MPEITEKHGLPTQSFTNYYRSQSVPFVVYADFESFTKPIHTCQPAERPELDTKDSYTKKYQKHEPSGFCYYIKCFDDSVYSQDLKIRWSSPRNPLKMMSHRFLWKLLRKTLYLPRVQISEEDVLWTSGWEREIYQKSSHCHICKDSLTPNDEKNYTVRDHCHFTGKFRGAAHNNCNVNYRKPKFFPVIFHNLAGYDAHLFIKNLGKTEG